MRFLIFGAALLFAASARAQTTLTATPTIVAPGGTVTAAWSGIASPSSGDALFMYPSAGGSSLTWRYTTGAASGSVPFTIPSWASPGTYVLRLYSGSGAGLLATSNNFTVAARTIAGSVTLGGSPLAGVSFSATNGGTCLNSDASGNYVCGVSQGWSGSITPSLGAHSFTPASRSYTNVTTNQTAQNYTALAPFELSGTVSWNGSPLAGVTMTASAGGNCTQTNASGQYTCAVPQGWTGNVTPSLANHIFSPASRSYATLGANQTAQDYAATVLRYVSGTARVNSLPVANVAFAASSGGSCTSSNSAGQYSCAVPDGWTGTVTPSHMGYSFSPSSRSYTSLGADDPAEDYTATPSSPASNISFVHADHLNTPRLVANAAGQTVWRWDQQEPFGVNAPDENPSGLGIFEQPLRFPGQYADKETNLHYNARRDYDPSIGRYPQADPLGIVPNQVPERRLNHPYAYADSDPISNVDPLGLCPCKGGIWDQDFGDWQVSGAFGAYGSLGRVNLTCRSNPQLKCTAKQGCLGGGPIVGAGLTFNLAGAVYGAPNSGDLGGWSGAQFAGGAFFVSGQGPWGQNGGNLSAGPGAGGGVALYIRCKVFELKCNCPQCP